MSKKSHAKKVKRAAKNRTRRAPGAKELAQRMKRFAESIDAKQLKDPSLKVRVHQGGVVKEVDLDRVHEHFPPGATFPVMLADIDQNTGKIKIRAFQSQEHADAFAAKNPF